MIKSKIILVILFICLHSVCAYSSNPNPGHGADSVYIKVNNLDMTLQQAIDSSRLNGTILGGGFYLGNVVFGHLGSEVWLNVSGTEKTLQQAINDGNLCCSNCNGIFSGYSQFSSGPWHYATNVIITNKTGSEKSLQQAIVDKEFCNPVTIPQVCYSTLVSPGLYTALTDEGKMSQPAGVSICANKYPAGTWRLPSIGEMSLIYQNRTNVPFIGNCSRTVSGATCPYWTSTFAGNNGYIWYYVGNFPVWYSNSQGTQDQLFFIRCVRSNMLCQ